MNLPHGRKPCLLLGMEREEKRELGEWEGVGRRGGIHSEDINSPTFKIINKVSI